MKVSAGSTVGDESCCLARGLAAKPPDLRLGERQQVGSVWREAVPPRGAPRRLGARMLPPAGGRRLRTSRPPPRAYSLVHTTPCIYFPDIKYLQLLCTCNT